MNYRSLVDTISGTPFVVAGIDVTTVKALLGYETLTMTLR